MTIDRRRPLGGAFAAGLAAAAPARATAGQAAIPGVVGAGAHAVEVYAGGRWCEGPVWDRGAGALVFSDVRGDRLMRLGTGGAAAVRDPSGFANGNGIDRQGRLVTCEHLGRRLVRQEPDGRLTVLADRYRGRRLNAPNDLAIARDGAIWFTDPSFGLIQPEEGRMAPAELPGRYVFRLDPDGTLEVVADGFEQHNGIAFSPDERTLYVSDASAADGREGRRDVRPFDVVGGRRLARPRPFATVETGVPGGLEADAAGRVWLALQEFDAVGVREADGTVRIAARDPRLIWPDSFVIRDGRLYISSSQVNRRSEYSAGVDRQQTPYAVLRMRLPVAPAPPRS